MKYSAVEWQTRVDLAACYRLADMYGFSDIIWNHITAKVPGSETFLINRFGLRYDEVTASNLLAVDLDGEVTDPGSATSDIDDVNLTGFVIHSAIHAARPDLQCVMHSHAEYGLAVSALEEGLVPLIQDAMPYFEGVAYHDYEGLSTNLDERQRLAGDLGDKQVMILRNHGLLTCGTSIAEAFMLMYYLERSCKVQIQVMASGASYRTLPADVCRNAAAQYVLFPHGKYEWPALLRLLDTRAPDFRD